MRILTKKMTELKGFRHTWLLFGNGSYPESSHRAAAAHC